MLDAGCGNSGQAIDILAYKPEHMLLIDEQDNDAAWGGLVKESYAKDIGKLGPACTIVRGDRVLCCMGLVPEFDNTAHAWGMMARDIGRDFLIIHRVALRFMAMDKYRVVSATVDTQFNAGIRWMKMLGFRIVGVREKFLSDTKGGYRDHYLYERVAP